MVDYKIHVEVSQMRAWGEIVCDKKSTLALVSE